jgi:hypothetical protein
MRSSLAQRASEDITQITDASLWYFQEKARFDPARPVDPREATWPGQVDSSDCTVDSDEAFKALAEGFLRVSPEQTVGYIPLNPWGMPYSIEAVSTPSADPSYPHCLLLVSTDLPADLTRGLTQLLPQVTCQLSGKVGYARCTTRLIKPGDQASISLKYFKKY